ncbi:unnamed protein product [Euphydryas editha]|uniref:Uncharacterized protein n=1 Tax=Euphydryas editha TaxID=104508 RepID=A0AAU9V3I8_EUPED|nr:unnamed protein product [Euphydryas editha]
MNNLKLLASNATPLSKLLKITTDFTDSIRMQFEIDNLAEVIPPKLRPASISLDHAINRFVEFLQFLAIITATREVNLATYKKIQASTLVNGFKESTKCNRLTVDEALMNHFEAIVMAALLSGADEVVLIGGFKQSLHRKTRTHRLRIHDMVPLAIVAATRHPTPVSITLTTETTQLAGLSAQWWVPRRKPLEVQPKNIHSQTPHFDCEGCA